MGAKPTKITERDVPAHDPLINNEFVKLHYFKDRAAADETQIRQENHFVVINKKGVINNGKQLVGLKKQDHQNKIYFINRLPPKYGGRPIDGNSILIQI